ncbi:hypothetical protein Y032_0119g816 [Ancylostoma ceylanicum]|nr:hypothetical protein Y032_0119g816 [Ancylostoma ceylanicum]
MRHLENGHSLPPPFFNQSIKHYKDLGIEDDLSRRGIRVSVTTTSNLRRVRRRIRRDPVCQLRQISREMGIKQTSRKRIFRRPGLELALTSETALGHSSKTEPDLTRQELCRTGAKPIFPTSVEFKSGE